MQLTRIVGDVRLDELLTPEQARELLGKRSDGGAKLGRNDPCPCGSGRKFKTCHYNQLRTLAGR